MVLPWLLVATAPPICTAGKDGSLSLAGPSLDTPMC